MSKKIFVGNLPFGAKEDEVREIFEAYGPVHSARIITDRETGRSRGFGFVEMDDQDAEAAIKAVNGMEINGRPLRVNEAQEKERRPPRPRRW